jgi:hypothetical protein
LLREIYLENPWLEETVYNVVTEQYQITVDDLPPSEDEAACRVFEAPLSRDISLARPAEDADTFEESDDEGDEHEDQLREDDDTVVDASTIIPTSNDPQGLVSN